MAKKAAKAKQPAAKKAAVQITLPVLGKGEHYAGIILEKGKPAHHLILLPGAAENVTWAQAQEFAKKAGGELPTRREQSLLFANAKEHFEERWYWSSTQYAGNSGCAWLQGFGYGGQFYGPKDDAGRARAVRREVIR